jgi:hypothetical protein
MIFADEAAREVEYNQENRNTYVSLPHLFGLPPEGIRHGIVLKNLNSEEAEDDGVVEDKIILLTTEVKCETEIPEEDIFPVPKALGGIRFSAVFSGIQFGSGEAFNPAGEPAGSPVLFLNIETLVQNIQREKAA